MNVEVQEGERRPRAEGLLGSVVGHRYRVDAILGDGTAGRLYRAAQLPLERLVALRVLPGGRRSQEVDDRFAREASIAGSLMHPNSVRLVDFGRTDDGAAFVAMEYLPGRTLAQVLVDGPLHQIRAIHVAQQICRSLREAHALQILHRGLRPSSVMLLRQQDEQDFVKVMDFGMPRASTMTELARMPTEAAHYLAPEQARNQQLDGRCDVYAVGAVLYEMLAGRPPFVGTCATDVIVRQLAEQPLPPRIVQPELSIDPALERIVLRCLAKDRAARFASMDELLDALKLVRAQITRTRAPTDTMPPMRVQLPTPGAGTPVSLPPVVATPAAVTKLPPPKRARTAPASAPQFASIATRPRRRLPIAALALCAAVAAAAIAVLARGGEARPPAAAAAARIAPQR